MQDNLDLFTSAANVDIVSPPGGHVDWFLSGDHETYFETPLIDWLATGSFAG
jgi:hypothetical protein